MSDKDIKIRISAEASGVKPGTDAAGREVDNLTEKVNKLPPAFDKGAAATEAFTNKGAALADAANKGAAATEAMTGKATALGDAAGAAMQVIARSAGLSAGAVAGVGAALAVLGGIVATTVAVVGAFAVAWYQAYAEMKAMDAALVLSGNNAGTTTGQMQMMGSAIHEATDASRGFANEVLTALAAGGNVAAEGLQAAAQAAIEMERAGGPAAAETVKQFNELGKSPVDASLKLNDAYHYLTESVYIQIKALQDQGSMADAAAVAQAAYADTVESRALSLKASLGTLETAWIGLKDVAKSAWDAMLNIGRESSLDKQLADAQKAVENGGGFFGTLADAKAKVTVLQAAVDAQRGLATATAETNKQNQAGIQWQQQGEKYLSKTAQMEKEIAQARVLGAQAGKSQADILQRIGEIQEKYATKPGAGISNDAKAYDSAVKSAEKYIESLKRETEATGLDAVQKKMLEAATKALVAPNAALSKEIMAEAAALARVTLAEKDKLAYDKLMNGEMDKAIKQQDEMVRAFDRRMESNDRLTYSLQWELDLLGMGEREREIEIAMRKLSADATEDQVDALKRLAGAVYDEKKARKATEDATKAYEKMNDDINRGLTDALMRGFESGKGFAENFVDTVKNMFNTLVLRPIISAIISPVSGAVSAGMSAMGFGGTAQAGGSTLGLASNGMSLYNSGGVIDSAAGYLGYGYTASGATYGTNFMSQQSMMLAGQEAGMGTASAGAAGGALAYGSLAGGAYLGYQYGGTGGAIAGGAAGYVAGSAAASVLAGGTAYAGATAALAAIPVYGWIALAVMAILSWDSGEAKKKVEGNALVQLMDDKGSSEYIRTGAPGTAPWGDGNWGRPGEDAGRIEKILAPVGKGVGGFIKSLGGDATGLQIGLGYNSDPLGEAPDNVHSGLTDASGKSVYSRTFDAERGKGLEAMQAEIPRIMLAAAQAVDISPILDPLMDGLGDVGVMTDDAIQRTLQSIDSISKLSADTVTRTFGEAFDPAKFAALAVEGENSVETFVRLQTEFTITNNIVEMMGMDMTSAFGAVGMASAAAREDLILAAGGIGALSQKASFFFEKFYSDTERQAATARVYGNVVKDEFASLGIAIPSTVQDFRNLVEAQDLSTESGRRVYLRLLDISDEFYGVSEAGGIAALGIRGLKNELLSLADTKYGGYTMDQINKEGESSYSVTSGFMGIPDTHLATGVDLTRFQDTQGGTVTPGMVVQNLNMLGTLPSGSVGDSMARQSAIQQLASVGVTDSRGNVLESARVPRHATGGIAAMGWALVGEEGPELVDFQTSGRVYTADQTRAALNGGGNAEVAAEIRNLREELNAALATIATWTRMAAMTLDSAAHGGQPLTTTPA